MSSLQDAGRKGLRGPTLVLDTLLITRDLLSEIAQTSTLRSSAMLHAGCDMSIAAFYDLA